MCVLYVQTQQKNTPSNMTCGGIHIATLLSTVSLQQQPKSQNMHTALLESRHMHVALTLTTTMLR
eukprot:m.387682 g.387682  ORF g.387682 m.387682 type:complete len:65 (+) comp21035_c0_seq1:81-275(+)